MNSLWSMFVNSLKLPQKKATFALNRIGMDTTVIYLFILLGIASIPTYIEQLRTNEKLSAFFFTIFFFIFHYLIITIFAFVLLSIIAFLGTIFAKSVYRKLRYSVLWKIAGAAATIPLLLFTVVSIFYSLNSLYLIIGILFIAVILIKVIFIYPRRKRI